MPNMICWALKIGGIYGRIYTFIWKYCYVQSKVETIANHFSLYHSEPPYGIEDLIDHMKNNMDFDELEAEICCEIAEDYNDFCNWEYKII